MGKPMKTSTSFGGGRAGKKGKGMADKVGVQKKDMIEAVKAINPFEVKINKQKFDIIGRKSKHDQGLPGVSRSKALKKRQRTLLPEYQSRFKNNVFMDKRIGEKNASMSLEDKMSMRYAAERMQSHDKKSLFNLADEEEELTHRGKNVNELDHFDDDPRSDDELDDAKLSANFVKNAHFGGGVLRRKEGGEGGNDDPKHGPKDWLAELILQSKKTKEAAQKEKDTTQALTEELDSAFKDLVDLLPRNVNTEKDARASLKEKPKQTPAPVEALDPDDPILILRNALQRARQEKADAEPAKDKKPEPMPAVSKVAPEDYDSLVRQLHFERKVKVTDKLPTSEQLVAAEKAKLEALEADRLRRMRGDADTGGRSHRSADQLDDDIGYGWKMEEVEPSPLHFKEGKLVTDEDEGKSGDEDEEAQHEEGEDEEEDGEEESDEEEERSEEDDNYSDLLSEDEEEEAEEAKKPLFRSSKLENLSEKSSKAAEAASRELPYVFKVPDDYDELCALFNGRTGAEHVTILERMLKCNHPSLGPEQKVHAGRLLPLCLQYLHDLAQEGKEGTEILQALVGGWTVSLYDLCTGLGADAAQTLQDVLQEQQHHFMRSKSKTGLELHTLLFIKLALLLYPGSDFRHPVTSPACVLLSHALSVTPIHDADTLARGIATCALLCEATTLSKRYSSEAFHFLCHALMLARPYDEKKKRESPLPAPFKPVGTGAHLISLSSDDNVQEWEFQPLKYSASHELDANFKAWALHSVLSLLKDWMSLWENLPAFSIMAQSVEIALRTITWEVYSPAIVRIKKELEAVLEKRKTKFIQRLIHAAKKPKALRLYEPQIEEHFDGKKKFVGSEAKLERSKLNHKYRRELKGALREIRRDNSFLASQQLRDQIEKDNERKRKVKDLLGSLANQEGEVRKLKKKK